MPWPKKVLVQAEKAWNDEFKKAREIGYVKAAANATRAYDKVLRKNAHAFRTGSAVHTSRGCFANRSAEGLHGGSASGFSGGGRG